MFAPFRTENSRFSALIVPILALLIIGCLFAAMVAIWPVQAKRSDELPAYPPAERLNQPQYKAPKERPVWQDDEGLFTNSTRWFTAQAAAAMLKEDRQNTCFSPMSLFRALGAAANTLEGEQQKKLLKVLGYDDLSQLNSRMKFSMDTAAVKEQESEAPYVNDSGSSMWLNTGLEGAGKLQLQRSVLSSLNRSYATEVFALDFTADKAPQAVAAWLRDKLALPENKKDKSDKAEEPSLELNPETALLLFDTLRYSNQWQELFDKDENSFGDFTCEDGESYRTEFMNRGEQLDFFAKGKNFTRGRLDLKGASLQVILPDKGVKLDTLLASPEELYEALYGGDMHNGMVTWKVPKFQLASSVSFKKLLSETLGLEELFTPGKADFTALFGPEGKGIFLGDVSQDTRFGLDENGVQASTFTEIDYAGAAMPEDVRADMILDRPFLFCVEDDSTLFIGAVRALGEGSEKSLGGDEETSETSDENTADEDDEGKTTEQAAETTPAPQPVYQAPAATYPIVEAPQPTSAQTPNNTVYYIADTSPTEKDWFAPPEDEGGG